MRDERYVAEGWGDSPRVADELGALIVDGTKTATCSALWEFRAEGPLCIVETTEVEVKPYDRVDARFAYEEGEGDCSLEYWQEVHWRFFSRTLPRIGKEPTTDMPLVCERFRVIYK
jgi:uncharacterized protein YhfF